MNKYEKKLNKYPYKMVKQIKIDSLKSFYIVMAVLAFILLGIALLCHLFFITAYKDPNGSMVGGWYFLFMGLPIILAYYGRNACLILVLILIVICVIIGLFQILSFKKLDKAFMKIYGKDNFKKEFIENQYAVYQRYIEKETNN